MKKNFLLCLAFFGGFWILFWSFQSKNVYFNTLGKISSNYVYLGDGDRGMEKKPYEVITNDNVLNWDGEHYYSIKEKGYVANEDWRFAFFPLFPYIWKLTGLTPSYVMLLNFLMFVGGLLLLAFLFNQKWDKLILVLALPMMVVFLIPYTEATFFLMFSIAVWGYMKDRYWLFCLGMILASVSRNTLLLIIPAILCTEILFFIKERKIKTSLYRIFLGCLPVLIGTATVSLIQYGSGSESLFSFIEVQKYWDHRLSLPNFGNLNDWSHESYGINIPILFMIGFPLFFYLVAIACKQFNIIKKDAPCFSFSSDNKSDYLTLFLLFCCFAAFCSVILFQSGNLHGLSRYVLCSPYFVVLVLLNHQKIISHSLKKRIITFVVLTLLSLIAFAIMKYTSAIRFHYIGYLIIVSIMALYLFSDFRQKRFYNICLFFTFLLNILWTTYLYNQLLCNGWNYA